MYLEGIKDKEDFKKMLPAVCQEKPVVIMKPGRSSLGKRVSGSHTASIAGDDDIFTAACAQYGAVRVYDLEAFYDTSRFFGLNPLPKGNDIRQLALTSLMPAVLPTLLPFSSMTLSLAKLLVR